MKASVFYALSDILKINQNLRVLKLNSNAFSGSDGVDYYSFCRSLQCNMTLRELEISDVPMINDKFFEALGQNQGIQSVIIQIK